MTKTTIILKSGRKVRVNLSVQEVAEKLKSPESAIVSFVDEKGEGAAVPYTEVEAVETYRPPRV